MARAPILTAPFVTAAFANFLFFTGLAGYFLLPLHLRELGADESRIGLLMGAYSATAIVAQPLVGAWVDRRGRLAFLGAGAALTAVAGLLFAAAPDRLGLVGPLRILQGAAFSVYFVAMFALVVELVPPERRGQALGVFGISGLTSHAVGPALGEVIVRAWGFRGFFLASAALAVAAGAIMLRVAEPPVRPGASPGGLPAVLAGIAAAPRLPMALGLAFGLGQGVIFTFLPTFAATLQVDRVGLFAVIYAGAALAVRAAGGGLVDTLGPRAVIVPAMALQALGAAVLAAGGPLVARGLAALPLLAACGLLAGTAHGFLYPALTSLVMDLTPETRRGQVLGVYGAFILAGHAGGAMAFGGVAALLGYGPMYGILAALLAAATALAFRLDR
jgi:MFS family permease